MEKFALNQVEVEFWQDSMTYNGKIWILILSIVHARCSEVSGLEVLDYVNEKQHHESEAEYYFHYRGSVYCTEQEFGTFYHHPRRHVNCLH